MKKDQTSKIALGILVETQIDFIKRIMSLNISIFTHTCTSHMISYHFISYHIISYHILSYHIISYHIYICLHTHTLLECLKTAETSKKQ